MAKSLAFDIPLHLRSVALHGDEIVAVDHDHYSDCKLLRYDLSARRLGELALPGVARLQSAAERILLVFESEAMVLNPSTGETLWQEASTKSAVLSESGRKIAYTIATPAGESLYVQDVPAQGKAYPPPIPVGITPLHVSDEGDVIYEQAGRGILRYVYDTDESVVLIAAGPHARYRTVLVAPDCSVMVRMTSPPAVYPAGEKAKGKLSSVFALGREGRIYEITRSHQITCQGKVMGSVAEGVGQIYLSGSERHLLALPAFGPSPDVQLVELSHG